MEDGLPQILAEWIAKEGLTHLKVKLNGGNLGLDVGCMVDIERVVSATQAKRRVREWKYSLDFVDDLKSNYPPFYLTNDPHGRAGRRQVAISFLRKATTAGSIQSRSPITLHRMTPCLSTI